MSEQNKTYKCSEVYETCAYAGVKTIVGRGNKPKKCFDSCDYILHTGKRRGCSIDECTRYMKKE